MRRCCALFALACTLLTNASLAATAGVVHLDAALGEASGQAVPAPLCVLEGAALSLGIDAVASLPAERFQPLDAGKTYAMALDKPLWLRMRVSAAQPSTSGDVLLAFSNVIVDRFEFYQRDAAGNWRVQLAGDEVAHAQWGFKRLRSSFELHAPTAGEHDVFVRIVHGMPTGVQATVDSKTNLLRHDAWQLATLGLLLGAVLTLALTCVQHIKSYQDNTYFWYAGYILATGLAAVFYSGAGQQYLMPNLTRYPGVALVQSVTLAFACSVFFARSMFFEALPLRLRRFGLLTVASCLGYVVNSGLTTHYPTWVPWFYLNLALMLFCNLSFGVAAWLKGLRFGGVYLLVYVPYLVALTLTLLHNGGLISLPFLPDAVPTVAAAFEAICMMLCLNAHSKVRHAQAVQSAVAAQHDPLTGFLTKQAFERTAAQVWSAAGSHGSDAMLALVDVQAVVPAEAEGLSAGEGIDRETLMRRSVRMVRTVAREFDVVGRVGPQTVAVVLRDTFPSSAANMHASHAKAMDSGARLQRLVALGLMRDDSDVFLYTVQFRIHAGFRSQLGPDLSLALSSLETLAKSGNTSSKPITLFGQKPGDARPSAHSGPNSGPNSGPHGGSLS